MSQIVRAHVYAAGRVQGVYFRESTRQKAVALSLLGWVHNLNDGRVEALVQGEAAAVDDLLHFLRNSPGASRVDALEVSYLETSDELSEFKVRRD